jgi:hypothetical protein
MKLPYLISKLFLVALLTFQTGCQKPETAYRELQSQDLTTNEFQLSDSISESANSSGSPLDIFAPPGVLENLPAKQLISNNTITQVSAVKPSAAKTTTVLPAIQNSDIKPFDPNAPLEEVVVTQSLPLIPKEIKLLIPEKNFDLVSPDNALRISYDDIDLLKVLNMDPVPQNATSYFPKWLSELNGKRVRIRGYMFPTKKNTGITYFSLARDTGICCFGPNGKVYDLFGVKLKPGTTANYMELRPFDVVGTFHIEPDIYNNILENIYHIDDAIIIQ